MDEERGVWAREERDFEYNTEGTQTCVLINGAVLPVEVGQDFRTTIGDMALNAGFGKYRVLLNGEGIRPNEAPVTFNLGDRVEIRAYDDAGNKTHMV